MAVLILNIVVITALICACVFGIVKIILNMKKIKTIKDENGNVVSMKKETKIKYIFGIIFLVLLIILFTLMDWSYVFNLLVMIY